MDERQQLEQAIATLEAQRAILGNAVVDPAIAGLRLRLDELLARPEPVQQRRQVTILFVDVVGSTQMGEHLDPEDVLEIMDEALQRFTRVVEQYHGQVDRYLGDGLMAIFGTPLAYEDDAERAVRAGLGIVEEAQRYALEVAGRWQVPHFQVRVGINTGLVALGGATEANYTAMGTTVNLAARLETAAPANSVLISHDTYQHVRGLFVTQARPPMQVKGSSEPVESHLVTAVRPRSFHVRTRGVEGIETRLIGREAELRQLQQALAAVQESGRFQAVTIVGEAGVGKTRLLYEFEGWSESLPGGIPAFKGRASLETQNLPGALIRDLFTLRFNIQESDAAAVARHKLEQGVSQALGPEEGLPAAHFIGQLIGFDFRHSPHLARLMPQGQLDARQLRDRAMLYLRSFFAAAAATAPTLILLEDIHWADASSLDLISGLAQALGQQPILLIGLARPTLLERQPAWGQNLPNHAPLNLAPLSPADSHHLVTEILQKVQEVPASLRDLVVNKAEGNPFYVEEIIKMLIEDGVIVKGTPFWWVEPTRLDTERIPTTLAGVLQASLDRLTPEERVILQQASVVGRTFWDAVVARINQAVNETISEEEVQKTLTALRGKEMIYRRETSAFARAQELIFKHAILREVTYESVLKRVRRVYHALVADWLIENSNERSGEYTGLIAEHLEKAGDRVRAIEYLRRAGEQAAAQYANAEAVAYFSRALELIDPDDLAQRYELLLARERIYDLRGEREGQKQALLELERLADALDEGKQAQVALRQANYAGITNDYSATIAAAQQAIALAQIVGDAGAQAAGYLQWGWALRRQGENEEAQLQMTQALELARLAQLRQVEADSLRSLGVAFDKHGDREQARGYYEQALTLYREMGDRRGEGRALSGLGNLANEQRDYAGARAYYQQNLDICHEIGDRSGEGWALWWLGTLCHQQQDYAGARQFYEQAVQVRREIGDLPAVAMTLTHLGRTAQYQGEYDAARVYCEEALQMYEVQGDRNGVSWAYWWLGGIYQRQADYALARAAYEQVLHIRRELDIDEGEALTLGRLGQVCLDQGDARAAQRYFAESLVISQDAGDRWSEGYALNHLGNVAFDLGDTAAAHDYYRQSLAVRQAIGASNLVVEPLAGLAQLCLAAGDLSQAQAYVEQIWSYLQRPSLRGIADLSRVYLACTRVLRAGEDGRLPELRQTALTWLQGQAAAINDEARRQTFLHGVATHRVLLDELNDG
ncbi:MAG: tetratricopeptide repeat protein [Chloroflexi bacterium]|nr:tetratricopeptide repeat protein [Chloroflexota bacterium]MCI0580832.1 tetratricopeptide repeat protein [Chloroflexota bacterium]MCI0648174.1 tetratricopeptide repeat protein [Chloroflexota bacterium]MCI0730316.1 tetratricopeptide repeat protein [Chloroflexota bacterium]